MGIEFRGNPGGRGARASFRLIRTTEAHPFAEALADPGLSHLAARVLSLLWFCFVKYGGIAPTHFELGRMVGRSKFRIRDAIIELRRRGYLEVRRGRGRRGDVIEYIFTPPEVPTVRPVTGEFMDGDQATR